MFGANSNSPRCSTRCDENQKGVIVNKFLILLLSVFIFTACAKKPHDIQADYVSPMEYRDFSCSQISGELRRVARRLSDVTGIQDKTANEDAWATGVGVVLFWPTLFFINSNDQRTQVARLKREFDALEQAAVHKNCDVAGEINRARQLQQQRMEEQQRTQKQGQQYN